MVGLGVASGDLAQQPIPARGFDKRISQISTLAPVGPAWGGGVGQYFDRCKVYLASLEREQDSR